MHVAAAQAGKDAVQASEPDLVPGDMLARLQPRFTHRPIRKGAVRVEYGFAYAAMAKASSDAA